MTTTTSSSVQTLKARLAEHDIRAQWVNTGGGCMALIVYLQNGDEILITDLEGPMSNGDWWSDEERYGWCVVRYVMADDGYTYPEAEIVVGGRDYAYLTADLADIDTVVEHVRAEIDRKIARDTITN